MWNGALKSVRNCMNQGPKTSDIKCFRSTNTERNTSYCGEREQQLPVSWSDMPEESHHTRHQGPMGEESPRLSSDSSVSGHDPALADCCSLSGIEHSEDERPVSTISTLSSGSSGEGQGSLFHDIPTAPAVPLTPTGPDIDLELSPAKEREGPSSLPRLDPSKGQHVSSVFGAGACPLRPNTDEPSPVATLAMIPNPQLTYVDRVVMEIVETERMYVRDLCSIVEDYLAHIIDTRDLPIKPEQVCSLFGNIEVIYEFNSELLQSLEMCNSDPVAIASCFVNKSQYFDIYTQYCTNYPNSVATLTECMRNKTLAKFFRDRQASLACSLPLGAYLLKPVQRILKYHLLLQEIAKHFDPEEEGYEVVEDAIDTMTGVAWYINDMKRKHEHAVRLQEIQSLLINWKGPDLTTYGELVLEGTFHVHRAKNERTLFLFEKMLLITKKSREHYVYKNHITCSTLMLIESAKDSLRFSVTHYKHPKQPHTMQAKTVEEKRLWAHHIKRLILENHHAIIPQKAKDAILDMRSSRPVKYRYSPERSKKLGSDQSEAFPAEARKGRRRSEPMSVSSTKGTLKHADSVGTLLVDSSRLPLQTAGRVTILSSSQGNQEVPTTEGSRSEWFHLRTNSLDRLSVTNLEVHRLETPFQQEKEEEKESEVVEEQGGSGEEEEEEILVKDEQDGNRDEASEENELVSKRSATPEEEQEESWVLAEKDSSGDHCSQSFSLPGDTEETKGLQLPFYPETALDGDREGEEIIESSVELLPPIQSVVQLENERTPSSQNLSVDVNDPEEDEDDDEEEEVLSMTESTTILPTSVLDKASAIAERFATSLSRRNSMVVDEFSFGHPSSQTGSRRSSVLSLSADQLEKEKAHELDCFSPEPICFKLLAEQLTSSTITNRTVTPEQRPPMMQDTLSKKDRMLIHKIKQYYEQAEHQDANFSIKRRESLSYIPAGLVRNLSRQIDGLPTDVALHRTVSSTRPASWAVFDLPQLDKEKNSNEPDIEIPAFIHGSDTSVDEVIGKNEDFRPLSQMINVWQDIEVTKASENPQDAPKDSKHGHFKMSGPNQIPNQSESYGSKCGQPLLISEESDNSLAGERCSTSPPFNNYRVKDNEMESSTKSNHNFQEKHRIKHSPLPKISLRSGSEEDLILQDMEIMKNKVFHLARQYSQRIKNSKPVVRQRVRVPESHVNPKNLGFVVEGKPPENEEGMQNLMLSFGSCEHKDVRPYSPSPSSCSLGSPKLQSQSRSLAQGPLSPVYTENFHWPDVRELRSKYSQYSQERSAPHILPISRSCSVPDRIRKPGPNQPIARRSCSCSTPVCNSIEPHKTPSKGTAACEGPVCQGVAKLYAASSFDHVLGPLHLKSQQNLPEAQRSYYISGQATMPNESKIIIVERIIGAEAEESGLEVRQEKMMTEENQMGFDANLDLPGEIKGKTEDLRSHTWLDSGRECPVKSLTNTENSLVRNLCEKFQNLS
ncbi:pleckstrin homology domain-containing family G member 3 isoform X2 [Electrophorus electricus]|uniref:pleckstrin homology domain-containing family G member 3 isoform X2 n=1 Tax=Electrophorus electricus TaxID=8005 RepID=UPI0015D02B22|nr:pleckstrin homology domain-containing family G member 3 isoform X2 [Electrophorus electricus]